MKTPKNIKKLVDLIATTSRKNYSQLLTNFDVSTIDFEPYKTWSIERYTRNCLYKDADFELIILCWEKGQQTPIHGHNGQDCWVLLLEGGMEEIFFSMGDDNRLTVCGAQFVVPNQVTFMNDGQGFHQLKNDAHGRSVSLHFYAKPIENCRSFDEKSEQFVKRSLGFDSNSHFTSN